MYGTLLDAAWMKVCGLMILLSVAGGAVAEGEKTPFADFPDDTTVALWLFEEPDYQGMMLTDASKSYWDLRLNSDSAHLAPGKYGNALTIDSAKSGVATFWAMDSKANSSRVVPFTVSPRRWIDTLVGSDWTIEFWLRLDGVPQRDIALLDMGPTRSGAHTTLKLSAGGGPFVLLGELPGAEVQCATQNRILTDKEWHHVAITFNNANGKTCHFLDGKKQIEGMPKSSRRPLSEELKPGLVWVRHADPWLGRPSEASVGAQAQIGANEVPPSETGFSSQWSGVLRAPATGTVTFTAEADGGVRLVIGGKAVIEHCLSDEPMSGETTLKEGETVPFKCQYFLEDTAKTPAFRLDWNWQGHEREPVPASAFQYMEKNLQAQQIVARIDKAALAEGYTFAVGTDITGGQRLNGQMDELRLSNVIRYTEDFTPGTFSRNQHIQRADAKPTGPALLWPCSCPAPGAVNLGTRKHVFIDDVLIASTQDVEQVVNPPHRHDPIDLQADKPWEGIGSGTVYEVQGEDQIRFSYGNGGLWRNYLNVICLATSKDGLAFEKPILGLVSYQGSTRNNILMAYPGQGYWFVDPNPAALSEERVKFMAFGQERGTHVFVSPDGVHARRNVTTALFSDCGGGVETYWDDQRGVYCTYMRHEGFVRGNRGSDGRSAFLVEAKDLLEPWPLPRIMNPSFDKITEEYPIPFKPSAVGQVYRTGAIKYPWAPDTYVAFPWRMIGDHELMQTELATSRDGVHWRFWGDTPMYMGVGEQYKTRALLHYGMVRRGDEIWQYANVDHPDAPEPHPSAADARKIKNDTVRLTQRLDGFVALVAGEKTGTVVTRDFIHAGNRLALNVAAQGQVRVAVTNPDGTEAPGFGLQDCEPITVDATHVIVKWKGSEDVSATAGYTLRLTFEMQNAELFAFEFESPT